METTLSLCDDNSMKISSVLEVTMRDGNHGETRKTPRLSNFVLEVTMRDGNCKCVEINLMSSFLGFRSDYEGWKLVVIRLEGEILNNFVLEVTMRDGNWYFKSHLHHSFFLF